MNDSSIWKESHKLYTIKTNKTRCQNYVYFISTGTKSSFTLTPQLLTRKKDCLSSEKSIQVHSVQMEI